MREKTLRMRKLIHDLNQASQAYYQDNTEKMSNYEYDQKIAELEELEKKTGIVLANSPSCQVGYQAVDELVKERHEVPMLSLDKTKEQEELLAWLGEQEGILSWKLDGLTIVLTYSNGSLEKAITRGNGEIGEVVSHNVSVFANIPLQIPFQEHLVLRGEAIISYSEFERINQNLDDVAAKYKNPRNLCSGTVRQLNNQIVARRGVQFHAFTLVKAEGVDFFSRKQQLDWLSGQGFSVVEYHRVRQENLKEIIELFQIKLQENPPYDYPSDGLVLAFDDLAYSQSLGSTSKFPKDSIAFKWTDEVRKTRLLEIEWSASRTGLINPVAIFEAIELEGTTVSRASVHNLSTVKHLQLGIGDILSVYKANMIIPQIAQNHTKSDNLQIPEICPICEEKLIIQENNEIQSLRCPNSLCPAKKIKGFSHLVSRDALNIEGLSENTLEKMIKEGLLQDFSDLFSLNDRTFQVLESLDGWGEKSSENLKTAIQNAAKTTLPRFLYALGISGVGLSTAKILCKAFDYDYQKIKVACVEDFVNLHGIGEILAQNIVDFFQNKKNTLQADTLYAKLKIEVPEKGAKAEIFQEKVFVITGKVKQFNNRKVLQEWIEERGGKVSSAISQQSTYLVNNDQTSSSGKNKKAKELGISIISEDELIALGNVELRLDT
ncbi:DNA ligase [Clostridia bacterium]|nr:DNA ligase [Clostridia bacterium]